MKEWDRSRDIGANFLGEMEQNAPRAMFSHASYSEELGPYNKSTCHVLM